MAKTGAGGADNLDGPGGGGGASPEQTQAVPLNEELIWKQRAQEAEAQLQQLQSQVIELEAALASANQTIAQVERRGEIDRELTSAQAIDLETARLLTEAVITEMDEPDVTLAVCELCESKPFLFASKPAANRPGFAMSPHPSTPLQRESLDEMAQHARISGNRSELLRYLRARRAV